jgi:hypothetical protein
VKRALERAAAFLPWAPLALDYAENFASGLIRIDCNGAAPTWESNGVTGFQAVVLGSSP